VAALSNPMSREPQTSESTDFFAEAACEGADTSVFFPVSDTFAGEAKAICATCPVAEACLEYAISTRQSDGVWGGLTAVERHRLLRRRQKVAREESRESSAA
jgi:WhiB family redox-sensing transcriptional regulator